MSAARTHTTDAWPAILTWRGHDAARMESVRVQLSGNKVKAYGQIVAAATAASPAFSASYDLVTDERGGTKRLSLTLTLATRERQLNITRDEENKWLVQDHRGQAKRSDLEGALDVDVVFSPFFNALPIRRAGIQRNVTSIEVPVAYVRLPELSVERTIVTYTNDGNGVTVTSPVADTAITLDEDGFILEYPGLAARI